MLNDIGEQGAKAPSTERRPHALTSIRTMPWPASSGRRLANGTGVGGRIDGWSEAVVDYIAELESSETATLA